MKQPIIAAAVQMNARLGDVKGNLARMKTYLDQAAEKGAAIVIFPELVCQGCEFEYAEDFMKYADTVPDGEIVGKLIRYAADSKMYLVAGLSEKCGHQYYNTAVLIGPEEGYIGKYQKTHLFDEEKMTKEPGAVGFPVFDTKIGKIGMLICWDLWFPEAMRILALQGADLICVPTAWVPVPGYKKEGEGRPMAQQICMAQAHMNGVYLAVADRVGEEEGTQWLGCSLIAGPDGWPLDEADDKEEKIILAEMDLREVKRKRNWMEQCHLFGDRRTDLYDEMLGSGLKPYRL